MNCRIWDKQENINGISTNLIFDSMPETINGEVILIEKNGVVTNIEIKSSLVNAYNFDSSLSALEIGNLYISYLQKEQEKTEEQRAVIDEMEMDIAYLMLEIAKINMEGF